MYLNLDTNFNPNEVIEQFLVSVIPYANMIENQYFDYLLPSPQGIYRIGEINPIFIPSKKYYVHRVDASNVHNYHEVTNIDDINETILDEESRIVATAQVMINKKSYLSTRPTVPARGIKVVQKLIDYEIALVIRYGSPVGLAQRLLSEFKPEYRDSLDIELLRTMCRYLSVMIHDFIGKHDWNHYNTKIIGLDIMIEKGQDYRICEWYEKKLSHEW